jgi:hypothetical protein
MLEANLTAASLRREAEYVRPAASFVTRVAYCVNQLPRVAWYVGHGLVLRRLSEAARRRGGARSRPRLRVDGAVPDRNRIYADMAKLFLQDLANVERGIYPIPEDHDGSLLTLIYRSRLFFATAHELNEFKQGDFYAPVKTGTQQPNTQELNQAREGDFYAPHTE